MRLITAFSLTVLSLSVVTAQPPRSLKTVPIPQPAGLDRYVQDRQALIVLGKAFFWDMQTGSDGRTACATCHFHAGADHRAQNQLSDPVRSFPVNARLALEIFPFRLFADPNTRNSAVVRDSSARVGSMGLFRRVFQDIIPGQAAEDGVEATDDARFQRDGLLVRRVTPRNSPSVINAVFNQRNFWDGRALPVFDGVTINTTAGPDRAPLALRDGQLVAESLRIDNASLASQSVGPIADHLEMAYEGRTLPKLGKKLLSLPPLALQRVALTDSVLGSYARAEGRGLRDEFTYLRLIQNAFQSQYWDAAQLVDATGRPIPGRFGAPADTNEYTQAEYNFSLFWGLALQAYQATLVSDDSPLDRFLEGRQALTAQEQEGRQIFNGNQARCSVCHAGPEFTAASFGALQPGGPGGPGGPGRGNGRAFQNTGVRPAAEDAGQGNGNFRSIGLRNIEFTGPYFHNGGQATLEQVVDFYARGGDFPNRDINPINLNGAQRAALVAFLKTLSDDRVRYSRAPFDHPELCVPVGHVENANGTLRPSESAKFPLSAGERWAALPAVGATGHQAPLQTFDEHLRGIGNDGSRAQTLTEPCTIPLPQ
jgi:cytochrome c peroxidase